MKKLLMTATLVALPFGLSACNKSTEALKAEAPADAMGEMAMPAEAKMAKGSGMVTAIDAAAGKITLDHGPIAELEWPAMKMGFAAKPELLTGIAVGDMVDFDVNVTGSAGEVTAIRKK
jgi:Cu(I)/Ag(I) efflux system periplasmic protein CusF